MGFVCLNKSHLKQDADSISRMRIYRGLRLKRGLSLVYMFQCEGGVLHEGIVESLCITVGTRLDSLFRCSRLLLSAL